MTRNYFRIVFGFMLAMIGLASAVSGLVITHVDRTDVHWGHFIVSAVFLFIGGRLMSPATADAIADAILKRLPSVWPGGRRASDPAAQPGVPLPPSVRNDSPDTSDIK